MNSSSGRMLTAGLSVVLVVVVGATIFFLLSRPANQVGPTPTPTSSGVAIASPTFTATPLVTPSLTASATSSATAPVETPTTSPSISLSPSPSPSATASLAPSDSPSPTVSPSPTISATPTASPVPTLSPTPTTSLVPTPTLAPTSTPSISPTAPQREFRLLNVGIDSLAMGEARVERVATFNVDGPSIISARVTNASANGIRLCVWREADFEEGDCVRGQNVSITQVVVDGGSSTWHASLLGTNSNVSPSADLTVSYNASSGRVVLDSFRFVGTFDTAYNGFLAEVGTIGDGDLRLQADFEGASESWRLVMERAGGSTLIDESGSGTSVDRSAAATGGGAYRVSFRSPEEVSGAGFVHAVISWP